MTGATIGLEMPDFLLLGPFEVRDGDRLVELPRKKHRALLAFLALRAGEVVSSDVLIEELWGAKPPKTAREALHNYVSQLRKELGADVIETRGQDYVLTVTPEQLDVSRFERLVSEAREADSAEERATILREALELWRGPALVDLAYEPFAAGETQRLEELRLVARKDLIDAELELGRHVELVPELEALVAEHPFRERLRGQLMLALYRCGRQADALAAYQDARTVLDEELGLEPSTALRELEQAILRQDPSLVLPAELPPVEERRKTVTVLFAEVAPTLGLDPERRRGVTVGALAGARAAIEEHGGSVETRGGDELLGVFGVPASHEDDALRALRAASEVGDGVRAGIDTGVVLAGHGFVSGDVVSTAKELQRRAAPGEVLVGEATIALCRDAVVVEAVDGARRLVEVLPGASGVARSLDAPLVGREQELAALEAAFVEARESAEWRRVTVAGEPGIGKTRLARELVRTVGDGATVLVGRCISYGEGATWLPLAEMLEQAGESLEPILAGAGTPGEVFLGARRIFERLAAEQPLVLIMDDLHWAEPTLLDLVAYLGEQADGPVLFLGLTREHPDGAIVLGPLSDAQAETLAAPAKPEVRAQVVEKAGGNPLFVEQLVAFAREGGSLDDVPPSVEALIAARLDLLEPDERALLQRAAVVGRLFTRAALHELGAETGMLALVQEKGFVRRLRYGYRFHHVLVRDVAYASLPKAERAELHERVADLLDERGETDQLVGYHLEQAYCLREELGRVDGRARRLAADAGARLGGAGIAAWKRGEVPATVNLLGRATTLLPEQDPSRFELLCELGPALRTGGELRRAEEVLEEASKEAPDRRLELRARLELAGVQLVSKPGQTADELLHIAAAGIPVFEAVGDDRSLGRAWRWIAHVQGAIHCSYAASVEAVEEALVYYDRSGWSTYTCLGDLASALLYGPTPTSEAIRRCEALLAHADMAGEARVRACLGGLNAMREEFDEARMLVAEARTLYEELGQRSNAEATCGPFAASVELLAGDVVAAERSLRLSCEAFERMGDRANLATRAAELADTLYQQRRFEETERWYRLAEEEGAPDDLPTQIRWRAVAAKLLGVRKEPRAERLAREAVQLAEATDDLNTRAKTLLDFAEVLQLAGRPREAAEAVEQAIELFERKGNVVAAKRARALLAELAPA
jgi:DNA-binding SARP family transcriptional activator